MVYRVLLKPSAQRELAPLPGQVIRRFAAAIDRLADDPRTSRRAWT